MRLDLLNALGNRDFLRRRLLRNDSRHRCGTLRQRIGLITKIDLDFQVSTRAMQRVGKRLVRATWMVPRLRQQTQVELRIRVDHVDLVAELGCVEAI